MRFGMNVLVKAGAEASTTKFLNVVARSGAQAVRFSFDGGGTGVLKEADDLGLKYALALTEVTPESAEADYESLKGGFEAIEASYARMIAAAKPNRTLGIILPQGLHLITKTSNKAGAFGLRQDQVHLILSRLISQIKAAGHTAVMPMRLDDAQGRVYPLAFDVTEIDTMLSPQTEAVMSRAVIDEAVKGRYWFGKAGALGGYLMPTHALKTLRKLESIASGAEFAFLWSEPGVDKWSWSQSGEATLDLTPGALAAKPPINVTGDPARAHWKNQQRAQR